METLSTRKASARRSRPRAARNSGPPPARDAGLPATPGSVRQELAGLPDRELLSIIRSQPRDSERRAAACETLVIRHRNLVWSCVQRYRNSPEPTEDLVQVGYVGLLKAINNFDPAVGGSLAAYALPCISGEVKRHFRDKRWQVHVERSVQERVLALRQATRQLTQQLGRNPTDHELTRRLGFTGSQLNEARRADMVFQPASLDAPLIGYPQAPGQPQVSTLADILGGDDPLVERTIDMEAVATHWHELPKRERQILVLRFYADLTQAQIGERLGISQMHVSRLLAHALAHLRRRLLAEPSHRPLPRAS